MATRKRKTKKQKKEIIDAIDSALREKLPDESDPKDAKRIPRDLRRTEDFKEGRPTVMTKQTLQKLEMAFKLGMPDRDACIYAGIAQSTLYNYCNKFPDFMEQKEEWKDNLVVASRITIGKAIASGDIELSKWWLQVKRKAEFADMRIGVLFEGAMTLDQIEEMNQQEDLTNIIDVDPEPAKHPKAAKPKMPSVET